MKDNEKINGVKEFLENFSIAVKKLHGDDEIETEFESYYARGYIDAVKYIKERIDAILN